MKVPFSRRLNSSSLCLLVVPIKRSIVLHPEQLYPEIRCHGFLPPQFLHTAKKKGNPRPPPALPLLPPVNPNSIQHKKGLPLPTYILKGGRPLKRTAIL